MPDPYPNELRHRLIESIEAGESVLSAANRFHVSQVYAYRIWARYRKTGSKDRRPQSHHGPIGSITERLKKKIVLTIQKRPQTTIPEIQAMLQCHGVKLGHTRVHQILEKLGCTGANRKAMLASANANSHGTKPIRKKQRVRVAERKPRLR